MTKKCDEMNEEYIKDAEGTMANDDLEKFKNQLNDYKKQFQEMDENGSGDIDIMELGRAMERLKKPKNQLELKKMIDEVDLDKSGTINYKEFLTMMLGNKSSVLKLILLFEAKSKQQETPKGPPPKKSLQDLLKN